MGRRTLLLIASILIAAVGTSLIALYVRGADARAQQGTTQVSAQFVIKDIPAGTSVKDVLENGYLKARVVAQRSLPGDWVGENTATISGQARVEVVVGAPLQKSMFGQTTSSGSLNITPNQLAASFELTDPSRVAGLLEPGMFVSVFSVPDTGTPKTLIKKVRVLRIGDQSTTTQDDPASQRVNSNTDQVPRAILTLDVSEGQEHDLLAAQRDGSLVLGVLADQSDKESP